jgi:hypothetical protein
MCTLYMSGMHTSSVHAAVVGYASVNHKLDIEIRKRSVECFRSIIALSLSLITHDYHVVQLGLRER